MSAPKWIVLDRCWDWEHIFQTLRKGSAGRIADEIERQLKEGPCVVVIDPTSESDVDRVANAIRDAHRGDRGVQVGIDWTATQNALRSLLPTPKPPEPMGLGAVVEDADGDRWVRAASDHQPWFHMTSDGRAAWLAYADIDVAESVSEGVVSA